MVRELFIGCISAWQGSLGSIPTGWALCDGTNGTPDLRDKFVVCSGDTYNPDDTGGSKEHNHDFTSEDHWHMLISNNINNLGADYMHILQMSASTGTTNNSDGQPPFFALAYIMFTGY